MNKGKSKPSGYWTYERCQQAAQNYSNRKDFRANEASAYALASARGWLNDICTHMVYIKKPNSYWTLDRCQKKAKKYRNKTEFRMKDPAAESAARKNGWIDEICIHMAPLKYPNGHWTLKRCKKEASHFKTRKDFRLQSPQCYQSAYKKGWLDSICKHMIHHGRYPNHHWTKDRCKKKARQYQNKLEFRASARRVFEIAYRNGWLDDICSHMEIIKHENNHWTFERCRDESLKFKTLSEFREKAAGAYGAASKNGWLTAVCEGLERCGNRATRAIYIYEFTDRAIYVGLTYNYETRFVDHQNAGPVSEKLKTHSAILTEFNEWMPEADARKEEMRLIAKYRKLGREVLNSTDGGELGGGFLKWDYDACKKEAKKYKTRGEFRKGSPTAYTTACKNNWIDKIATHMARLRIPRDHWTYERCKKLAKNCKTRTEFQKKHYGAYMAANKKGWIEKICSHMKTKQIKARGYWTLDKCKQEAKLFKTITEFSKGSSSAYDAARRNSWLDKICKHMERKRGGK